MTVLCLTKLTHLLNLLMAREAEHCRSETISTKVSHSIKGLVCFLSKTMTEIFRKDNYSFVPELKKKIHSQSSPPTYYIDSIFTVRQYIEETAAVGYASKEVVLLYTQCKDTTDAVYNAATLHTSSSHRHQDLPH